MDGNKEEPFVRVDLSKQAIDLFELLFEEGYHTRNVLASTDTAKEFRLNHSSHF
jgi:hypothetical protein